MKIKTFIATAFSVFLFSNSAFGQNNVTTVNCPTNRAGIDQANDRAAGAPGHTIDTRRGNNGKGNGGESFDVYVDIIAPGMAELTVVCIKTADENTFGTQYLLPLGATEYIAIGSTRELDPGMLGSNPF